MEEDINSNIYISHGSDWPEHEDFLVGNKKGLESLIVSINEAIEKGESKNELYEFVGVRCLDSEFFIQKESVNSNKELATIWAVLLVIGFVLITGIITIISWL